MKNIKCPLCLTSKVKIIKNQVFDDKYLDLINKSLNKSLRKLVQCSSCGVIRREPQMEALELKTLYINYRNTNFRGENPDKYFERIINIPNKYSENYSRANWMLNNLGNSLPKKNGKLLDIGCGAGTFMHVFKKIFPTWKVYGVEPTKEFAILAKEKVNAEVFSGSILDFNSNNDKFNLITLNLVLEHILDINKLLLKISSIIKPKGYLYIEVPDSQELVYEPDNYDRFQAQHLWHFSGVTLLKLLHKHHYKVHSIDSILTLRGKRNLVGVFSK